MKSIAYDAQPITGRGVGYKLFSEGPDPVDGDSGEMQRVYRLLKEARERGMIEWDWIVDEGTRVRAGAEWDDPAAFARAASRQYRRDFWNQQPDRCRSIGPRRARCAACSLRCLMSMASVSVDARFLLRDRCSRHCRRRRRPSADCSLCRRLGSERLVLCRNATCRTGWRSTRAITSRFCGIALVREQLDGLPSFPATDKRKDTRYPWFTENYGTRCWELDALDPNELRACVEKEIKSLIEPEAWRRCEAVNSAERE